MVETASQRLITRLLQNTTLIMFVLIFAFFGLQSSSFIDLGNFSNIVKNASYIGIIAVGMTFVLLTAGIDISVGSNMYLSALIAGLVMQRLDFGVFPAFLVAVATGALFGAVNGFCIVQLKIIPFVVTLATLVAGRGIGTAITESISLDYPQSLLTFGQARIAGIPMPILVFAGVVLIAQFVLTQTPFGRQVYAVGNDPEAAKKAGINVGAVTGAVYVICGICAAIGGFALISQIGRLDQPFGKSREFDVISAAVLGGTSLFGGVGNAWGAVIGAVLIQMVENGLVFANINLYLQPMIQAVIIFLAVFFDALRGQRLSKLKRRFIRTET